MSLQETFSKFDIDTTDGIKFFVNKKTWFHIRPSGTEPLLRIIGESDDKKLLEEFYKKIERIIIKRI